MYNLSLYIFKHLPIILQLTTENCKRVAECDQFSVSISSIRYTKYILSYNQLKEFLYHENHQKLLGIWFFRDFQGAEFLGPNYFQEGVLSKKWHFFHNFHLGRNIFPSLTKSRACFEIPNIWQESQSIWLLSTIKSIWQILLLRCKYQ